MKKTVSVIAKVTVFMIVLGGALFALQKTLDRNWYWPSDYAAPDDVLDEYYQLAKSADMQVVLLGASGFVNDISPMEIYKDTGIRAFNLSSRGQPLPVRYYLIQEVLETQPPDLVIMDPNGVFSDSFFNGGYHYILDHMPLSRAKIGMAAYYASVYAQANGEDKELDAFLGGLIPLYQYHDRWTDLTHDDFTVRGPVEFYKKGYLLRTQINGASNAGIDEMNVIAAADQRPGWVTTIQDEDTQVQVTPGAGYEPQINETGWDMVRKVKALCEEKGVKFLLMKTPTFGHPVSYDGAWTEIKSKILKERAAQDGIPFLDMLYDTDLGIDFAAESGAGVMHLNFLGMQKTTRYLENYLQDAFGLTGDYSQEYEKDVLPYDAVRKVAELEMTSDLETYFERLSQMEDVTAFFSVSDDVSRSMTEQICQTLNRYGLETNFSNLGHGDAYLAVVENGKSAYEAYSNRPLSYEGELRDGTAYSLSSSGYYYAAESTIVIDGTEQSENRSGLNIVVYDNISGYMVDSLRFPLNSQNNPTVATRTNSKKEDYIRHYEDYVMRLYGRGESGLATDEASLEANYQARTSARDLGDITSFNAYLDALAQLDTERYSVFMAVKDIQGFCLTPEMTGRLKTLGFDQADTLLEWVYHSFVGVLSGDGVYQQIGTDLEPSHYEGTIRGVDVSVDSMVLEGGNTAAIVLDGQDYALNSRGINIVVYDHETDSVADSVVFDTHVMTACMRNELSESAA